VEAASNSRLKDLSLNLMQDQAIYVRYQKMETRFSQFRRLFNRLPPNQLVSLSLNCQKKQLSDQLLSYQLRDLADVLLQNHKSLKHLKLSFFAFEMQGRESEQLIKTMKALQLNSLHLHRCYFLNAEVFTNFFDALHSSKFSVITLDRLSYRSQPKPFFHFLHSQRATLEELTLRRCSKSITSHRYGGRFFLSLVPCLNLRKLCLPHNHIDQTKIKMLDDQTEKSGFSLTHLDLSDNELDDQAAVHIVNLLARATEEVEELNLGGNHLTMEGLELILNQSIDRNGTLKFK